MEREGCISGTPDEGRHEAAEKVMSTESVAQNGSECKGFRFLGFFVYMERGGVEKHGKYVCSHKATCLTECISAYAGELPAHDRQHGQVE